MNDRLIPIRAVIFDMDGLLIDSEPFWQDAEILVFGRLGLRLSREDCRQTMGLRIDEVVAYWNQRAPWSGAPLEQVAAEIVDEVIRQVRLHGKPLPGAREVIAFFRRRAIPMAIASSSYRELIDAVVSTLAIGDDIALTHSAQDEPFGKPHPGVYLTASRMLGVAPAEALAFEDSPNGARAAEAAGMRCVFVPDPGLPPAAVRSTAATLRLASLTEFDEAAFERCLGAAAPGSAVRKVQEPLPGREDR